MKRILVLMAAYNGEKYLERQLNSLFSQTGVGVSLLVRDDGSEDRTLEILKRYAGASDLHWYKDRHKGIPEAYYDLMKKAAGTDFSIFAFCDQDDVWDQDKLAFAIKDLEEAGSLHGDKPMLYYCGQRITDRNLRVIRNHRLNPDRSLLTRFVLSDFAGCTGVFNRALLEEVISYKPEYMLMHDSWTLKVCLALGGKVVIDPRAHMCYRQHGENAIGLGRGPAAAIRQVKQYLMDYQVERQMRDLCKGYGTRMVSPYRQMAAMICRYRKDPKARKALLDPRNVDFHSRGLNAVYFLKVILNRL